MARILAYTSPARGHLYPLTPILDELRSRGHQIALRTLSSEVELMRSRGFDCEPLDPVVEGGHDDYLARTPRHLVERDARRRLLEKDFNRGVENPLCGTCRRLSTHHHPVRTPLDNVHVS